MAGPDDDGVRALHAGRTHPIRLPGQQPGETRLPRRGRGIALPMYTVAQLIGGVWGAGGDGGELVGARSGRRHAGQHGAGGDGRRGRQGGEGGTRRGGRVGGDRPGANGRRPCTGPRTRWRRRPTSWPRGHRRDGQAPGGRPGRRRGGHRHAATVRGARARARRADAARRRRRASTSWRPQPRGVVAAITPWNDPVAVSCGLLGAALVTGNVVLLQAERAHPGTGWLLARLLAAALPDGVLSLLTGDGEVGAALAAPRSTWWRTSAPPRPGGRSPPRRPGPGRRCCWRTAAATR